MSQTLKNLAGWVFGKISPPRLESNFKISDLASRPRRREKLRIDRFSDELPYAHFDDSEGLCTLSAPDGSFEGLGFVIEIAPQTGATEIMAKSLEQLFGQSLPDGAGVQVTLFGSPYVRPLTDAIRHSAVRPNATDNALRFEQKALMEAMAHARADFLMGAASEAPHPEHNIRARNLRCWLSVCIPTKRPFDPAVREKVLSIRTSQVSTLKQWHFSPWVWNHRALINTLSQILNPHRFLIGDWEPTEPEFSREPRMQCVFRDTRIEVLEHGIKFYSEASDREVTAVSLSPCSYPQNLTLQTMIHAAGSIDGTKSVFSCPFLITSFLSKGSYEKGKATAKLKSARAEQMAATEIARVLHTLRDEAKDWRCAVESYEQGEGLVQLVHEVMIFPETRHRVEQTEAAKGVFKHFSLNLSVDDYMHLQGLLSTLPMTAGPLLAFDLKLAQRSGTKTSANAANSLPLLGDWKGTGPRTGATEASPVLTLLSRRGQILHVDPFANPNGNYNGIVSGSSGSGKSVLLNELAMGTLRTGGRVYIIDVGGSYEKLCHVVKGQFIELSSEPGSDGRTDCLNPFSLVTDPDEDMDLMLPLLAQMASPSKPLDDLLLSHLQVHFRSVWEKSRLTGRTATITDLAESLLRNGRIGGASPVVGNYEWEAQYDAMSEAEQAQFNDPRLIDLGVQFLPYAKGGPFAEFFEGEANINFDNNFMVLELRQLSTRKSLQSVVLLLLMYMIDLEMRKGERSQPKLVIIDEAWDLMGSGHTAKFIETGYRRARKQNGSFFTATQAPGDYWKSDTAKAALDNADCVFLLSLKSTALEAVKREGHLGMDEHELKMLSSLTSKHGVYSEVYVRIGDAPPSVNRLVLDPYSLLLMSSNPKDISDVNRYKGQGLSTHEAIVSVLKERQAA